MSQIKKIGVIGAGNMGSGIAQKFAMEGLTVTLVDASLDQARFPLEACGNDIMDVGASIVSSLWRQEFICCSM